jgi:hypothetical protein
MPVIEVGQASQGRISAPQRCLLPCSGPLLALGPGLALPWALPWAWLTLGLPQEASEAIKPILGDYYKYDGRNIVVALWGDWKTTRYVAPDEKGSGVMWFRK